MRFPRLLGALTFTFLAPGGAAPRAEATDLAGALTRLAARAALHKPLLYEFHCTEKWLPAAGSSRTPQ